MVADVDCVGPRVFNVLANLSSSMSPALQATKDKTGEVGGRAARRGRRAVDAQVARQECSIPGTPCQFREAIVSHIGPLPSLFPSVPLPCPRFLPTCLPACLLACLRPYLQTWDTAKERAWEQWKAGRGTADEASTRAGPCSAQPRACAFMLDSPLLFGWIPLDSGRPGHMPCRGRHGLLDAEQTRSNNHPASIAPPPCLPPSFNLQAAAKASRGWESWMRSAWGRWHRTKDATQETWDAAKDQAYR